jgi:predicted nucleic acid-binding protein
VLDSFALIGYLENEPFAQEIEDADSFAAALAKVNNALLLTGDPEFRTLEKDGVLEITWLT